MIKVIVVDLDDVVRLYNKKKQNKLAISIGFDYSELMKTLWENDAGIALLRGKSTRNKWWKKIQSIDSRLKDKKQSFIWDELFSNSWIDTELVEYVRTISQKFPTAIFTNCDAKSKGIILEQVGDNHPFSHIITSAEIGFAKPDSTAFLQMLTIVDAAPKEVLFFDDNTTNVIAARGLEIEGVVYSGLERFKEIINIVQKQAVH